MSGERVPTWFHPQPAWVPSRGRAGTKHAGPLGMLVTLGARNQVDDLVDLLAACHRRIRQHVVLARRLVAHGADSSLKEVGDTASQIRRYFAEAFPLHIADEDQSIAPRLLGGDAAVVAAVQRVAVDHRDHQHLTDALIELCSEIEREPRQLSTIAARLSRLVESVATELAAHLELEERVLFPALRMLPPELRTEILEEMRQRRKLEATNAMNR